MLYAIEWFNIPKDDYANLVRYHPYLTKRDEAMLENIEFQNIIDGGLTFALTTMASS